MEIEKIALIFIKDRKILFALSAGKSAYYLPGGKRKTWETEIEALKREILEELSCQIDESSLEYYGTFFDEAHGKPDVRLKSVCYMGNIGKDPQPSGEVEKIAWINSSSSGECTENGKAVIESLKQKGLVD